jgi:pimeloyl-ACP methyl ester carboxylesterase
VAQEVVLKYPAGVRKVILAGTGPRGGDGMQETRPDVVKAISVEDKSSARAYLFFSQTDNGKAQAQRFLGRSAERKEDLDKGPTAMQTMGAQGQALGEWGKADSRAPYLEKLKKFGKPTLVVNGNDDIMVPTINSYTLAQTIPDAELVIYPDSGHGAIFQYAELFVAHVNLFLDRSDL